LEKEIPPGATTSKGDIRRKASKGGGRAIVRREKGPRMWKRT